MKTHALKDNLTHSTALTICGITVPEEKTAYLQNHRVGCRNCLRSLVS